MKWIRLNRLGALPHKPGLYAIYNKANDKLLYIGKSMSLYDRFNRGGNDNGYRRILLDLGAGNVYIKYKLTDDLWMEKYLIRKLSPPYNFMFNKKAKFVRGVPRLNGVIQY